MMENTEIIKALRCESVINDEHPRCESCKYGVVVCHGSREDVYGCDSRRIENDAADALEAADKRIAELEGDLLNGTIINIDRYKVNDYKLRDLILFADMCKRNDVQEADLKQAAWNLEFAIRAWKSEREEIVKNMMDEITMRFTPDFEKAFEEMLPSNGGARMRGEHDEQADC